MKLINKKQIGDMETYYLYFDNDSSALVYVFNGKVWLNGVKKGNKTYYKRNFKVVKAVVEWLSQYAESYYTHTEGVFVANDAIMEVLHR